MTGRFTFDFNESVTSPELQFFSASGLIGSPITPTLTQGTFYVADGVTIPANAVGAQWRATAGGGAVSYNVDITENLLWAKLNIGTFEQPVVVTPGTPTGGNYTLVYVDAIHPGAGGVFEGAKITCTLMARSPVGNGTWTVVSEPVVLTTAAVTGHAEASLDTNSAITPQGTHWRIHSTDLRMDFTVALSQVGGSFNLLTRTYD